MTGPVPGAAKASVFPRRRASFEESVRRRTLGNGARLFVLENRFNPTVAVSGSMNGGSLFAPPDRRLLASVTAGELAKGTSRSTKLEIAEELESRGASLSFSAGGGDPVGVDIAAASLSHGRRRHGRGWHRRPVEERIAAVESVSRDELVRFYEERYGAGTLLLVLVGDVDSGKMLDGLERRLGSWRLGPAAEIPKPDPVPAAPGSESIRMPDKASADVVLAQPSDLARLDPEYVACILANSALGQSSLTSRLGVRVRDTEGLTYGIHSGFAATHLAGPFSVSLTVKPESRDAAVAATLEEIVRFRREGMTPKELADEQSSHVGRFKVDLASNGGIAHAIDAAVYYGLGVSYLDEYPSLVGAVTREEADAAFAKRVDPDRFTIVSAGSFDA